MRKQVLPHRTPLQWHRGRRHRIEVSFQIEVVFSFWVLTEQPEELFVEFEVDVRRVVHLHFVKELLLFQIVYLNGVPGLGVNSLQHCREKLLELLRLHFLYSLARKERKHLQHDVRKAIQCEFEVVEGFRVDVSPLLVNALGEHLHHEFEVDVLVKVRAHWYRDDLILFVFVLLQLLFDFFNFSNLVAFEKLLSFDPFLVSFDLCQELPNLNEVLGISLCLPLHQGFI